MNRIRVLTVSIAALLCAAALAACGSSGGSSAAPPAAASSGGSSAAAAPSSSPDTLKTASVGQLGVVVVDSQGMTVYRFDADSNNPPASHCSGTCAGYWPPVLAGSDAPSAQGISASLLGTVTWLDGTKQVTLAGWPLYTYIADHAAGDANGQGLNAFGAKWWAVTASGGKAGSPSSGAPSSSGSSGASGYGYGH